MEEFDLIERFFARKGHQRKDVMVGVGDDCAILKVPENQRIAITTDTLVENVHFLSGSPPRSLAYKAVAVNLSDLASMGAEPAWISLSLTLPESNEQWMKEFTSGLYELLDYYSIQLVGGDTVSGPCSVTITAQGFVPPKNELLRSNAKPGDWIYVTGNLGDAGAGLALLRESIANPTKSQQYLIDRYLYPTPRVMMGQSIRRIANACIDVSDGLLADLRQILKSSQVGARIQVDQLPLSKALRDTLSVDDATQMGLSAGDDYELIFTVSEEQKGQLETALASTNESATCIGQITGNVEKIELKDQDKPIALPPRLGFEHFCGKDASL